MQSIVKDVSRCTTLLDYAVHWARIIPNDEAMVFRRQDGTRYSLTWSSYLHLGKRFAARLQRMGIVKGDVICNYLVNSPERVVTELGTMLAGAVPMHGETLLADKADVTEILNKAKVRTIIIDPKQKSDIYEIFENFLSSSRDELGFSSLQPENKKIVYSRRDANGKMLLLDDLEVSSDEFTPVPLEGGDDGYIFPTSGSTGFSKLALHTHGSLVQMAEQTLRQDVNMVRSRCFVDMSCGWIPGFIGLYIVTGATRVLTDFQSGHPLDYPAFIWEAIVEEKCQLACLMTKHVHSLYQRKELWQNKGVVLNTIITGGQPISKRILGVLESETGFTSRLVQMYGLTEVPNVAAMQFTEACQFVDYLAGDGLHRPVKIVDDTLNTLPACCRGEILVKSPAAFKGYLGDSVKTKEVFTDDGWIRTNDLGYLDDRGRLFVLGRRSDAIMKGLCVVFPSWLETRIRQCPGVADVVIVPVPDEVLHHEICACVVRKDGYALTESDIDSFCQRLFVSGLDDTEKFNPKYFLFFDSFPLNKNDKTDRKQIRAIAAERVVVAK